jgi:hypothetical protein
MIRLSWLFLIFCLSIHSVFSQQRDNYVIINEIRIDQTGADIDEYFELKGAPYTSLDSLTYLVIGKSDSGKSGVIEEAVRLKGMALDSNGYFVTAEKTFTLGTANKVKDLNFKNNQNVTHLLVRNFIGAIGNDLDTNDDGTLDIQPWSMVLDKIALAKEDNPPATTCYHYGPPQVGPLSNIGHVYRDPSTNAWQLGNFDPLSGQDTPNARNHQAVVPMEKKTINGPGVYTFVDSSVIVNFLSLSGSDTVTVQVFADSFPPNLPTVHHPVKRFVSITAGSNITAFKAALQFKYLGPEFASSNINSQACLYCARYDGSNWLPCSSIVDTLAHTVSCTTTAFSLWGIGGPGGALPVDLSSFTAVQEKGYTILRWATESEMANLGWNVLRGNSPDKNFIRVNTTLIPGHGTTSIPQAYSFVDSLIATGTFYYQLEQIDLDGNREYSWVVAMNTLSAIHNQRTTKKNDAAIIISGPGRQMTISLYVFITENIKVSVCDVNGNKIGVLADKTFAPGTYNLSSGLKLPSGIYFVRAEGMAWSKIVKILIFE